MSEQSSGNATGLGRRRGKRFLSPSEKYEIWIGLVRGEYTIAAAAGSARSGSPAATTATVRRSPS